MVDKCILASRIAAVRDAVDRIRAVLPDAPEALEADRTAREVVVLNLFVALQETLTLASHWLADEGLAVPSAYADVFRILARNGVIHEDLAGRLAAAAGLRNVIAHRYVALDLRRIHQVAVEDVDDLLAFCAALARAAGA